MLNCTVRLEEERGRAGSSCVSYSEVNRGVNSQAVRCPEERAVTRMHH